MKVKGTLLSRCVLMPGGERLARSSFCEQKEAKKFHDGAARAGVGDAALSARPALQGE
jgi:hypothetical protein